MIVSFTKRAMTNGTWLNLKGGACALSIVALLALVTGCPQTMQPPQMAACEAEGFSCDDGLPCNGAETCMPDDMTADEDGCVAGAVVECPAGETCNATTGVCEAPAPDCTTNDDCMDGEFCEDGACVAPAENDLAAGNAGVNFADLSTGTAVSVTAPDFNDLAQVLNEGCSCSWTALGAGGMASGGTFDPNNEEGACTTSYTPAANDVTIQVDVTCAGETRSARQNVGVTDPPPPVGPAVSLDCPGSMGEEEVIMIAATTSGFTAGGTFTFAWTANNGDIDLTGNPVTLTSTNPGASNVSVTVTNTVPGDPDADPPVADIVETATGACSISKSITELLCDAGPNRTFTVAADTNAFNFADNITSFSTGAANALPSAISGSGSDAAGTTSELRLQWSVNTVPEGMSASDVVVTSVVSTPPSTLSFFIVPNQNNAFDTLEPDATVDEGNNGQVSPGTYSFTLTVTRQDGTASASCGSDLTIANRFTFTPPVAGAGPQSGTTPANGTNTSFVTIEGGTVTVPMVVRSLVPGTLNWVLDELDADNVSNVNLNTETLMGSEDLVNSSVLASAMTGGSYDLTGSFLAGEASVSAGTATAVNIFVTRDVFAILDTSASPITTPTLDSRPAADDTDIDLAAGDLPRYGRVTAVTMPSTDSGADRQVTFHGLHDETGPDGFDGIVVRKCDLDADGNSEILILDDNLSTLRVCSPFAADPSDAENSPRNNDGITDGEIDTAFQKFTLTVGTSDATDFVCCDLNNDGDLDLVTGLGLRATSANRLGGAVQIRYGDSDNAVAFGQGLWPTTADATFTRTNSGFDCIDHLFGWRVWCTDFNGDGNDDIIASAPGDDGDVDNLATGTIVTDNATTDVAITGTGTLFTTEARVGDVIVINDSGGGADSEATDGDCAIITTITSNTAAVTNVDFSADIDTATSFQIHRPSGRVYMIPGLSFEYDDNTITDDPAALGVAGAVIFGAPTGASGGDLFGASIACCDLNGDARGDLAIGAPGFDGGALTSNGAVFVAPGTVSGTAGTALATTDRAFSGDDFDDFGRSYEGDANRLGFGRQVVCCDYNGNGTDDIVVSAADDSTTNGTMILADNLRGRIYILLDYPNSFDSTDSDLDNNFPQVSGRNTQANLGAYLSCGDFNGDGFWDIMATSLDSETLDDEDNLRATLYLGEASPSVGDGNNDLITADLIFLDGGNPAANSDWLVAPTAIGQTGGNDDHEYSEQSALIYHTVGYAVICDINGDGAEDILISESTNEVSGLFGHVDDSTDDN